VRALCWGPECGLGVRAPYRPHRPGLAVEPAPEADDLGVARAGLREPHGRLHRFGAARIELGAVEVAGGELREQLDEGRAVLRREAPHVDAGELAPHRLHVLGVRVTEARHADAGEQVDVAVSVGVIQDRTFPALNAQLAEEGDALP